MSDVDVLNEAARVIENYEVKDEFGYSDVDYVIDKLKSKAKEVEFYNTYTNTDERVNRCLSCLWKLDRQTVDNLWSDITDAGDGAGTLEVNLEIIRTIADHLGDALTEIEVDDWDRQMLSLNEASVES